MLSLLRVAMVTSSLTAIKTLRHVVRGKSRKNIDNISIDKTQETIPAIDNRDFIKLGSFCMAKKIIEWKDGLQNGRDIYANYVSHGGLTHRI